MQGHKSISKILQPQNQTSCGRQRGAARHQSQFKIFTAVAGPRPYVASAAPWGTGPKSEMISRWQDQTRRMASGVPMPAARGLRASFLI